VEKLIIALTTVLFLAVSSIAGELPSPTLVDDSTKVVQKADSVNQLKPPQNLSFVGKPDDRVSAYKVNYASIDQWPINKNAQVKFQISMKFRVLELNLYIGKYNLFPAYIAYTQQSLWDVGRKSMPFEESNYNPEFFLDYPVDAAILGSFKLHSIVVSPFEHESNGLIGTQSRSWNRQYILIRFALESKEKLENANSFLSDKASFYVTLWHASGLYDQDAYFQSIGTKNTFIDYMGEGEIGISIRNFIWGGSLKDHQLDIRTPIFRYARKDSYKVEFRQQLPSLNVALYLQYWYGYGETLLRFDHFGRRGFIGVSFSY
jgi:phospholipase A1